MRRLLTELALAGLAGALLAAAAIALVAPEALAYLAEQDAVADDVEARIRALRVAGWQ